MTLKTCSIQRSNRFKGNNTFSMTNCNIAAKNNACPATDQRGRPFDGDQTGPATCDIGAYDFERVNSIYLPMIIR